MCIIHPFFFSYILWGVLTYFIFDHLFLKNVDGSDHDTDFVFVLKTSPDTINTIMTTKR